MVDLEKAKNLFNSFDFNKNGIMEKGEFIEVFSHLLKKIGAEMPDRRHEEVAEEAYNKFDLNSNGVIEFEEFLQVITFFVEEKGYKL